MKPLEMWREEEELALAALRPAGLLCRLRLPQGIDLVSNDFLGLASHPQLIEAMRAALPGLGGGAGGSRLLRGHDPAFERVEVRLARLFDPGAAPAFPHRPPAHPGPPQTPPGPRHPLPSDLGPPPRPP